MTSGNETSLRIRVLNPEHQPLGGTVNVDLRPEFAGKPVSIKAADASHDIDVSGLERGPRAVYQVVVTSTDSAAQATQFVTIPTTGFNTVELVIDKTDATKTEPAKAVAIPTVTTVPGVAPAPVPGPTPTGAKYTVQGTLTFDTGLPASSITVRVYDVVFGGKDLQLGQATSDAQGSYSVSFQFPQGATPNIQVRVVNSSQQEVTISTTEFRAQAALTLNLVVPSNVQPAAPEYQRLSADMDKSIGGVNNLARAQEGQDRQDLTLLNQTTNWDARLVSLAASAAQQTQAAGIGSDVLYALYRVGLPTDPSQLAMVPQKTIESALAKANQSGVVNLNAQQMAAASKAFQGFSVKTRMAMTATGAIATATFGSLLAAPLANFPEQ